MLTDSATRGATVVVLTVCVLQPLSRASRARVAAGSTNCHGQTDRDCVFCVLMVVSNLD